jgi:hypothetical protein
MALWIARGAGARKLLRADMMAHYIDGMFRSYESIDL